MRKILIITGDNTDLIEQQYNKLINDNTIDINNILYGEYPEVKKHPTQCCNEVKSRILKYVGDIVILTFSEDILNLIGHMIYKNEIPSESVKVYINTSKCEHVANYDSEGFLENYPIGYFNWLESNK